MGLNNRPLLQVLIGGVLILLSWDAHAVPSFARQTGLACSVCHDVPPQLTAFGRIFKLDGYVLTTLKQIQAGKSNVLSINRVPPLSVMLQVAGTTATHEPASATGSGTKAQNTNIEFPQQFSIFYAGEVTPHIGAFMQITYNNAAGHFGFDNTDIRYARQTMIGGNMVAWGLDANNNPTVEDLWNDTPAWGFPWVNSDIANHPFSPDTTLINGLLAQGVAGLGEYSMWNNEWYEDLAVYRTSAQGVSAVNATTNAYNNGAIGSINGAAPYWRFAWEHSFGRNYLEVGTFGMEAHFIGGLYGTGVPGLQDSYTDTALDSQYEHHFGNDLLTVYGSYIHERQDLASTHANDPGVLQYAALNNAQVTGTYQFGHHYQTAVAYFATSGTANPEFYSDVAGGASPLVNGNPNSDGYVAQVTYLPWENTQFTLQYTIYTTFNGTQANASQNNSLYLLGWFLW